MLYANHVLSEHMLNFDDGAEINETEIISLLNAPQLGDMDSDI